MAEIMNGIINDHQQSVIPPAHLANEYTAFDRSSFSLILTDLGKEVKRRAALQCEIPRSVIESQQDAHAIAQLRLRNRSDFSQLGALSYRDYALIQQWNSKIPEPLQVCLHEQVRQVARQQPHAPAVESWDAKLSYAQLDELSDRLALYLISAGVQPEMILPLFLEKSTAAVVCIVGVLKSGGVLAFMAISQPRDRLATMFRDIQASVVLCSTTLLAPVKSLISSKNVISIDMSFIRALPPAASPVRSLVKPSCAATVTFTSGSTGTPKGVVLSHQSIATGAYHVSAAIGLSDQTRSFQFCNFIFDNAIGDLAITLSRGGCMCIPSDRERDEDFVGAFNRMQCNLLIIVPSLASTLTPSQLPTLRKLLVAGETITRGIVETWGSSVCLINGYGPTEATAWSSCCVGVTSDSEMETGNVGSALGCRFWVVKPTDHNKLVPIGNPGELLIEGPNLARGYLNKPDITAAAFIEAPTWTTKLPTLHFSRRFYKTGDVVVQSDDGSIVFKARKDRQVKLRGLRIELEEIEHHLRRVAETGWQMVVELIQTKNSDTVLAVFYTSHISDQVVSSSSSEIRSELLPPLLEKVQMIRQDLAAVVPEYMVPLVYVHLKKLPRQYSGKVDRKTLREIGANLSSEQMLAYNVLNATGQDVSPALTSNTSMKPALTSAEAALQKLWATVLSEPAESLFTTDNFFARGGNSIRAMRLVAAARRDGLRLAIGSVFKAPSLSVMASSVSTADSHPDEDKYPAPQEPTIICSSAVRDRLAQLSRNSPQLREENIESVAEATSFQSFALATSQVRGRGYSNGLALNFPHSLDQGRLIKACEEVIRHNAILRTVFFQGGSALYQVVLNDLSSGQIVTGENPTTTPFPHGWVLPRFRLCSSGALCHRLCIEIHHALYDAISLSLVLQDLATAYENRQLSNVPTFHRWLSHPSTLDLTKARDFWTNLLQEASMTYLAPPPVGPVRGCSNNDRVVTKIDITKFQTSHNTLSTAVKAAWSHVLSQVTGLTDVVFMEMSANRNLPLPDMDRVRGPCLNMLPIRARVEADMTLSTLISQLQMQANDGLLFHHLGLRPIMDTCAPWPAGTRLGSVLVFQNHEAMGRSIQIDGQNCTLRSRGSSGDSVDIVLMVIPGPESLMLMMEYSTVTFSSEQIGWLSRYLQEIIENMSDNIELRLDKQAEDFMRDAGSYPLHSSPPSQAVDISDVLPSSQARNIVSRAWKEVGILTTDEDDKVSMFASSADIASAMLLSEHYQFHGYEITTNDVVDRPSRRMQALLLDSLINCISGGEKNACSS